MNYRLQTFTALILLLATACQPMQSAERKSSSSTAPSGSVCSDDLDRRGAPPGDEGISVFRLFRTYPPQPGEAGDGALSPGELILKAPELQISAACRADAVRNMRAHIGHYSTESIMAQARPLLVRRTANRYLLGLLHPDFVEGDGEGSELAVSFVIYDTTGRYVGVVPHASSWRTYEGTELIQEACVADQGITTRKIVVYPETQDRSGRVIRYEKPEVQGLAFYPTTGEMPSAVKFDCASFPPRAFTP